MAAKIIRWLKKDKNFIKLMREYENNEAFGKEIPKEAWDEISGRVNMPAYYCRRKWHVMKHTYLKLKHMINIGRVTEDMVRQNEKTSRYLDGRLNFLDRYIAEIPDAKLSSSAHNFFESAFGIVDPDKLIKVRENSVIEIVEDYTQESGPQPTSILPNNEFYEDGCYDSSAKETFVDLGIDRVMEEDYEIDNNSDDVEFGEPGILPNLKIQHEDDLKTISSENPQEDTVNDCPLACFLVNYATTRIETGENCNLKEYMNDLAEVLCRRLAPEKRKDFLSRIDLIVSEILEGS